MIPRLFLAEQRHHELHSLFHAHDPEALAYRDALSNPANAPSESDTCLFRVCRAWLDQNADEAAAGVEALLGKHTGDNRSDLSRGGETLALCQALDYGDALLPAPLRKRLVSRICEYAHSFTRIGQGNPHIITNNWYMITHGACLLACVTAHGEEGVDGPVDLSDLEAWALGRFRAFCGHFGNAGLYHEGTGYIHYTLSMLLPALVAVRNRRGIDIADEFPQLRLFLRSILCCTAALPSRNPGEPPIPSMLDWNDAGRGCGGLNPYLPALDISLPQDKGALREVLRRLIGVAGGNDYHCSYRGLPLALALHPFDIPAQDPNGILPTHAFDTRQGLGFWRSEWAQGRESVFGWYARSTHAAPGHNHDDAGSIRLMANGRSWICGGGQARDKALWQSVITHPDTADRPKPRPYAYPFTRRLDAKGGVIGIEMRQVLQSYAERYLSWRSDLGFPFCLALLDQVDDHKSPPRPWTWNLSFPNDLKPESDDDGRGFRLIDPDFGTLHCRFLLDAPDELNFGAMPDSQRTYSGGGTVHYPGDGVVSALFRDRGRLAILAVLVIVPPGEPAPALSWENGDIRLTESRLWQRPFAGAILRSADIGKHRPNFQLAPAGEC